MNSIFDLHYLDGGDAFFGENYGESSVYTVVRRHFPEDCPNVALLLKNLTFTIEEENELMGFILGQKMTARQAALSWLKRNPERVAHWFEGVTSISGESGTQAFKNYLSALDKSNQNKKVVKRLPLGETMESTVTFLNANYSDSFRAFSLKIERAIGGSVNYLLGLHPMITILSLALLAFFIQRSARLFASVVVGLLLIESIGLWQETIQTLVLLFFAGTLSMLLGVPLGIISAKSPRVYFFVRPLLDLMQTIPTFVYLIPTLMFFGLGMTPGLISTFIFAVAAPIRLTYLGLKGVPQELIEAGNSFGATSLQRLIKIEIPYALPSIMLGFTQCIMLSLSMVVIAALVGADGLGTPVVRALNTVNIAQGFESGIAIVILAIVLDRTLSLRKTKGSP